MKNQVQDNRQGLIIMEDMIDDMGLDVHAFRLYVHIANQCQKHGIANETISSIANTCKMNEHKTRKALQELIARRIIIEQQGRGYEIVYPVALQ